jgi:hypothetical protein
MTFKNKQSPMPIIFEIVDDFIDNNNENEDDCETNNDDNNDDDNEIIDNIKARMQEGALPATIYRFKFTEEFMEDLHDFSKIHQYDHRKDFKEAWVKWTEVNEDIISKEVERLKALGYPNDDIIEDKMFKSARYYFRKKSSVRPEPKQRRQYIVVDHELLDKMDFHIISNIYNDDYKPKTAFVMFCKEYKVVLQQTILTMGEKGVFDAKLIEDKIKKTYKNRYFMLTNK